MLEPTIIFQRDFFWENSIENKPVFMFDDVVQDVRAHVESVVTAKVGELEERLSKLLSGCAKEGSFRGESDAVEVLLAGVETRFREEHATLVDAINAHTAATNAQTALLTTLCGDVKAMNENIDVLCSHTGRLGDIEGDVVSIAGSFQGVANGIDAVSSFVLGLNEHLDDIRLVVEHKTSEIRKAEEEKRLAELKEQEEKRKVEEAAMQKEEQESEEWTAEEALRALFSVNDLEVMAKGVNALKEWTGKARATIVFDSDVDDFTPDGLFANIRGKPNIALIGFTTDGDVFGGFYRVAVTKQDMAFYDPNIFAFSSESRGRCATPQRFVVKEKKKGDAGVGFYADNWYGWFVRFDGALGWFFLGSEKSKTFCVGPSRAFANIF